MWEALGVVALVLVVIVPVVPAYVLLAPPVAMACRRRLSWPALVVWALSLLLLVVWVVRDEQFNARADVEGTAGNAFAGVEWLLAAVVLASASLALLRTRTAHVQVAVAVRVGGGSAPPELTEGGARGPRALAVTGFACVAASMLLLPTLLTLSAVVFGGVAHYRGDHLGRFVVALALISAVLPIILV